MIFAIAEGRIMMIKIKSISILGISLFLFCCTGNVNKDLYGNWAVLEVFYQGNDVSGIDRSSKVTFSISMEIDNAKDIIYLPTKSDETKYGYFKHFIKDDKEWLKIYDSTDPRFNGEYLVHLKLESSSNKGKNSRHSLELESKEVYIYAIKMTASL